MQSATHTDLDLGDRYLGLLGYVLLGYAVLGKGFAYLGVPPLFIGEICALLGLATFLLSGRFVYALAMPSNVLLLLCMAWVLLRTIPYVGTYGIEALRDSVIVMYGVFGLIVSTLLIANPGRLDRMLQWYRGFVTVFLIVAPIALVLTRYAGDRLPQMPFGSVPIIMLKSGDAGVHLAAIAVAGLLGLCHIGVLGALGGMAVFALAATDSRGALLTIAAAVLVAMLFTGRIRRLAYVASATIVAILCLYAVETQVLHRAEQADVRRTLSVSQLLENVTSIFFKTEARSDVQGTKEWRLLWWAKIIDDTVFGPDFWTGRGFGINLAEADGFLGTENPDGPPLRSPHNAHMTMLARAGVPGLLLWTAVVGSWILIVLRAAWRARELGEQRWHYWLTFIACYCIAFLVNASFDVALEGPMQGIWFWCVFGCGIGATTLFYAGLPIDVQQPEP